MTIGDLIVKYCKVAGVGHRWILSFDVLGFLLTACDEMIPELGGKQYTSELEESQIQAIVQRFQELKVGGKKGMAEKRSKNSKTGRKI